MVDEVVDDSDEWRAPIDRPAGALTAPAEEEQSPAERMASMLQSAVGVDRSKVCVYRIGVNAHDLQWANNYTVEEFEAGGDLQLIRRQFGAGKYSIRIFGKRADSTGFRLLSRLDLDLLSDPVPLPASSAPGAGSPSEMSQILALLADRLAAPPPPAPDPMQQMTVMFGMMKMMREAMGPEHHAPAPKTLVEQITELRALQEVARELAPKEAGADEPSLLGLGAQVMDMVKTHVANRPPQLMAVPPVRMPPSLEPVPKHLQFSDPHTPYPTGDDQYSPALNAPEDQDRTAAMQDNAPRESAQMPLEINQETPPVNIKNPAAEAAKVTKLLEQALILAKSGAPAEEGANLLMGDDEGNEGLPDEMFDLLMEDNWWSMLTSVPAFAAQLTPHEKWIREVREILMGWMTEDIEDEPLVPGGEAGVPPVTP